MTEPLYKTFLGSAFCGDAADLLEEIPDNSVDLFFTSPPFALVRKKDYGNADEQDYVAWFLPFAEKMLRKMKDTGSLVLDLGGAYLPGRPVRSLYQFRLLIRLCDDLGFRLAEEFFWHNPSRLPSPTEWVNKRRVRVKDSVDVLWWLTKTDHPKADNRRVLVPYSESMRDLIAGPAAGHRVRPSGHEVTDTFRRDNGGAIPPNLLTIANTDSGGSYLKRCRYAGVKPHPARFPPNLPRFFIRFLTEPGDLVIDPFAGSNTTGAVCEEESRVWQSFEMDRDYAAASLFRFRPPDPRKIEERKRTRGTTDGDPEGAR